MHLEALKAIAVEAFKEYMKQAHGGYLSSDLDDFRITEARG